MENVTCVGLKVAGWRWVPSHQSRHAEVKKLPFTVSVRGEPPGAVDGLIVEIEGCMDESGSDRENAASQTTRTCACNPAPPI